MPKIIKDGIRFILIFIITSGVLITVIYKINPALVDYIEIILMYSFLIILFYYSLNYTHVKNRNNNSIYNWLDRLDESDSFILKLLDNVEVQKDLIGNLEVVYKKLLVYSGFDLMKLRLLKGYFKSLNNEAPFDLFVKVFITFLFGVFATNLSNGNIFHYFTRVTSHQIIVSNSFQSFMNVIMLIIMFLIGIVFIIREMFTNKKRTKIIEEILDVCIKELESKK